MENKTKRKEKMKNNIFKFICKKCGKEMPVDEKQSNKNWKVYKTKCICGCEETKIKFMDKK